MNHEHNLIYEQKQKLLVVVSWWENIMPNYQTTQLLSNSLIQYLQLKPKLQSKNPSWLSSFKVSWSQVAKSLYPWSFTLSNAGPKQNSTSLNTISFMLLLNYRIATSAARQIIGYLIASPWFRFLSWSLSSNCRNQILQDLMS